MLFRQKLRQLMAARGLTAAAVAARIDADERTVRAYTGEQPPVRLPRLPTLMKLADALGVVVSDLVAGVSDVDPERWPEQMVADGGADDDVVEAAAAAVEEEAAAVAGPEVAAEEAEASPAPAADDFGDRLNHYRRQARLSVAKLAKAAGLSTAAVNSYLVRGAGRRVPSFKNAVALARVLGVGVERFADPKWSPEPQASPPRATTAAAAEATEEAAADPRVRAAARAGSVAKTLRRLLKWKGWSAAELTRRTGLPKQSVDRWLAGGRLQSRPGFRSLLRLSRAFAVSVDVWANCREYRLRRRPSLAEVLTRLLAEKKLSAKELAAVSGLGVATVQQILERSGPKVPFADVVFALARGLGVSADVLAGATDFDEGGGGDDGGPTPNTEPTEEATD